MDYEEWYKKVAAVMGIDKDPNHPKHFYDYKAAFEAGEPIPKKGEHMTSKFKSPLHPNRFVSGKDVGKSDILLWDTLNEAEASMQDVVRANYEREQFLGNYGF